MTITILREAPSFEGTQVRFTEQSVSAHISPSSDLIKHPGTLTITDECLYFHSSQSAAGFAIPYPSLIIHATARESPYGPSIYCQIEGSLRSSTALANGSNHDNAEDEEDEDDSLLEIYFTPSQPTTLDSIYENLSYCVSLHPDGDADDFEDEDMYEDDEEDHDALFMEADIQGGYTPRHASSATATTSIGHATSEQEGQEPTVSEAVPAIDINSGEWYTGNPDTDAKFELSEEGKVIYSPHSGDNNSASRQKRTRADGNTPQEAKDHSGLGGGHEGEGEGDMMVDHEQQHSHRLVDDEEEANLDRMEKMLQDPHHLLKGDATPNPADEEPGQDAEEDRFKDPSSSL